jgi:ankyrin repeat protein
VTEDGMDAYTFAKKSGRQILPLILAEGGALYGLNNADLPNTILSVRRGAFPEIRNAMGWTPLMLASFFGVADSVEELLDMKVNPNRVENDGWTALHIAAHEGHEGIVRLLLNSGAKESLSMTNKKGDRPADIASTKGHTKLLALLKD